MPHFGLMNTEDSFTTEAGSLLRARLHIRGGKRRLRQAKISAGIITLYDALVFAFLHYVMNPVRRSALKINEGEDLSDDRTAFTVLLRSKVVDDSFDYDAFDHLVEKASNEELADYDCSSMLASFERLMTQLGVMPFDENALPPEDPSTF